MGTVPLQFTVNRNPVRLRVPPTRTLLRILREDLRLTGTKEGCGRGDCGACTILLDGSAVNSCLILGPQAEGRHVTTIEGLDRGGALDPLQQAFVSEGAIQCGFCTPGMIMSATALLRGNPHPSEREIRTAISGNLCRCTGYVKIVKAVQRASRTMSREGHGASICRGRR